MHALITGGSSGIGKALGNKLAAAGYDVSLIARRRDLLAEAAEEIRRHVTRAGQRVGCYAADVADRIATEDAVKAAIADFGAPDMIITSAGISEPGYFAELPIDNFERAMAVNYMGTLYAIRAALPSMRARKRGQVVLVSSGAALMGIFGYSSYGPSKFAVRGLAETLRAELLADKIGVFLAYPPDTETPMLEKEMTTAPAETRLICSLAKTWTADAVADYILDAVRRGRFAITPGATLSLMHRLPGSVIPLLRWYSDRLVRSVRKPAARKPGLLAIAKHAFMTYWYLHARTLNRLMPSVTLEGKRLVVFPGVYKPLENEQACSQYCREGDKVLDLGCGSGVASVFCAPKAREVVAVDISLPAVRNTEENCRIHGLKNVTVMQGDMFSNVEGKFDVIMANAPYIDDEFEAEEQQFATSRKYIVELFAQAGNHLAADGRLVLQFPSKARPRLEKLAAAHGLEIVSVKRLPPKRAMLSVLSALYLQIGFQSAIYLLRRRAAQEPVAAQPAKPGLRHVA